MGQESDISGGEEMADFIATTTRGSKPLLVTFTDTSGISGVTCFWQFGDGMVSREKNPLHEYIMPGEYTVSLSIYFGGGLHSQETKMDYIHIYDYNYVAGSGINVSITDRCLRLGIQPRALVTKQFISRVLHGQ